LMSGAFVNHFKVGRGEFRRKFCNNRVANRHMAMPLKLKSKTGRT
jgi:hypothetical protein